MIFVDLDDTLFQTRRKNPFADIPATTSPNPLTVSFMSQEQKALLELLKSEKDCSIIPITARDYEQYCRTNISRDNQVSYASIYFGADILHKNESDPEWKSQIMAKLKECTTSISDLKSETGEKLDQTSFLIHNVDDYYLVIKHRNKVDYEKANSECYMMLKEMLPPDFHLYHNDNNISIVPKCIDKRNAVEYLVQKMNPRLTIGVGDSISDWNFMDSCHFKIIPQNSQINRAINQFIV
jgi:hydroxymethylpyrimidine pyrophosphatase-like HAD family hydrolase